jgi:hypothetical protein
MAGKKWMTMLFAACLLMSASNQLAAEIIDRIAISVGNQVITEQQIDDEIRLTAFLNHEKVDFSQEQRKKAAGRLIEQALVKRDMEFSRYPLPGPTEAEASLKDVKAGFISEEEYERALREYAISEDSLMRRLLWQVTLLRFVDYRFRPGIQISDADIQAYYDQETVRWKQQGDQVPALEDVRGKIEETLTEQRINESLDQWLIQTHQQVTIRYLDEALK